jgi:hypothetical protein
LFIVIPFIANEFPLGATTLDRFGAIQLEIVVLCSFWVLVELVGFDQYSSIALRLSSY